ncbi:MAG TPA: hypothetical protein VK754_09780 [Propionibacteriaceae bacterium]|nr:hypothetical protein [Propionibacteriaceae bacterium]
MLDYRVEYKPYNSTQWLVAGWWGNDLEGAQRYAVELWMDKTAESTQGIEEN